MPTTLHDTNTTISIHSQQLWYYYEHKLQSMLQILQIQIILILQIVPAHGRINKNKLGQIKIIFQLLYFILQKVDEEKEQSKKREQYSMMKNIYHIKI